MGPAAFAPGSTLSDWVVDLAGKVGIPNVTWGKLRGGDIVNTGMPAGQRLGTVANAVHAGSPDGIVVYAGGVVDHEPTLLEVVREHPLE